MLVGFHKLKLNACPGWVFSRDQAISKHVRKLKCRNEKTRIRGWGGDGQGKQPLDHCILMKQKPLINLGRNWEKNHF